MLDGVEVASLPGRGFRGPARAREHWQVPVGDRRTNDQLTRCQAGVQRLQAGLLHRVRDVFRAAGALVCLGRWLHRVPDERAS